MYTSNTMNSVPNHFTAISSLTAGSVTILLQPAPVLTPLQWTAVGWSLVWNHHLLHSWSRWTPQQLQPSLYTTQTPPFTMPCAAPAVPDYHTHAATCCMPWHLTDMRRCPATGGRPI